MKLNGWVCYDADCPFCVRLAGQFRDVLAGRRFELTPLQAPWVRERLGLEDAALLAEMRLLKPDGETFGGADALLEIGRAFWWAWPLRQLGRVPPVMQLFRAGYRWIARQRSCAGGACEMDGRARHSVRAANVTGRLLLQSGARGATRPASSDRVLDFLPLVLLPLTALLCQTHLAAWIFMWAMAFALYGGCKWLTYRLAVRNHQAPGWPLTFGYLLVWPGMNAVEFFNRNVSLPKPRLVEWAFAVAKIVFGSHSCLRSSPRQRCLSIPCSPDGLE